jgi:hypothetical protein
MPETSGIPDGFLSESGVPPLINPAVAQRYSDGLAQVTDSMLPSLSHTAGVPARWPSSYCSQSA